MPRNPYDELRAIGWKLTNPGLPCSDGIPRWAAYRPYREGRVIASGPDYQTLRERIEYRNAELERPRIDRPRRSRVETPKQPGEGDTSDV